MQNLNKLLLLITLTITGCATSIENRMLERGQYVEAYTSSLFKDPSARTIEHKHVLNGISTKTNGENGLIFARMMNQYMENHAQDLSYFYRFKDILKQALSDKLLNPKQYTELNDLLLFQVGKESIRSPKILEDKSINIIFPDLNTNRLKIAINELERLKSDANSNLNQYIDLYIVFLEFNDIVAVEKIKTAMRLKINSNITDSYSKPIEPKSIDQIIKYINITGDRTLDKDIIEILKNTNLSKSILTKGDIPKIFPIFSAEQIEKRTIKINIISQKDEFIVGEIIEAMKKGNEWLDFSDEATRKFTIGRVRFQEDRTQPTNMTETVQDPSFVTLLMIPKNASVLFDYSTTEYHLQWNMTITDSQSKGAKAFSGQRKGKKTECRNMRYQNIFGGTGSIYSMPNDAVSNFCLSNSNTDFEQIRAGAINEIADEIRRTFLAAR